MNAPAPAIALRGLERRFGEATAVAGLTFEVAAGELFGLVGPDGAGKTTTLRMIAGVLRPTAGDAIVAGISVAREPEAVKPKLAYMAQRFGLYEDLTVQENIDFYADLYRVPGPERPRRVERLYAFSSLGPFRDRLAGQLSGGMKQKLSLSCALVHRPEILLLDEPTFGVDPISRRDLWLILHEMVAQGVTILLSTSYLDEAERCDRIALLDHGRVVALDTPVRLQQRLPATLLSVVADPPRRARDVLRTHPGVLRATLFGDRLHVMVEAEAVWAGAGVRLAESGVRVLAVERVEPSLEDVFIELVQAATA